MCEKNNTSKELEKLQYQLECYYMWLEKDAINNREKRLGEVRGIIGGLTRYQNLLMMDLVYAADIQWNVKRIRDRYSNVLQDVL